MAGSDDTVKHGLRKQFVRTILMMHLITPNLPAEQMEQLQSNIDKILTDLARNGFI